VIPFAANVPARPAAEPEPGEEDEFDAPALEPVGMEEGPPPTALYLPNYDVEGDYRLQEPTGVGRSTCMRYRRWPSRLPDRNLRNSAGAWSAIGTSGLRSR